MSPLPLFVDNLIDETARRFAVKTEDLLGKSRSAKLVDARHVIALVLREKGYSYPRIGKVLNRDHSTVMSLLSRDRIDLYAEAISILGRPQRLKPRPVETKPQFWTLIVSQAQLDDWHKRVAT